VSLDSAGIKVARRCWRSVTSMSESAGPHVEVDAYVLGKLEADEADAGVGPPIGVRRRHRQSGELRGLPKLLARAAPTIPLPRG
jgi:hypothetical protein